MCTPVFAVCVIYTPCDYVKQYKVHNRCVGHDGMEGSAISLHAGYVTLVVACD